MSNCWRCRSAANTTKEEKGRKKIRGYNLAIKKNKLIIYKHNLNEFPEKAKGQSYKVSLVQYNFIDIRFKVIEMQINGSLQRVTEDKRSWVNIMVPYSDRSVLILTLSRFIFCYYKCNSSSLLFLYALYFQDGPSSCSIATIKYHACPNTVLLNQLHN